MLIIPELFYDPKNLFFLSAILLSYIFGVIDTYFRPFSESMLKDASTNPIHNIIILALFIFNPLLIIWAFQEYSRFIVYTFPIWDNPIVSLMGILILSIGGFITVSGRAQLSKYGSGVLRIEKGHKLITIGIFRYIRHPIYAGGLFSTVGLYLSFHSILLLTCVSLLYFIVIRHRLLFEEQLLVGEFGEKYKNYMKKTKRLIPFLY